MRPGKQVVGRFTNPANEVLRFGANPSVSFPASQIQALDTSGPGPAAMQVNFMGLTGPSGILPLAYSSLVIDRVRVRDYAMRDFFDVFNHRITSLFYQAWEKYRFEIPYERGERDRFSYHVLALLGLGTPGLEDRQEVPDDSLLFYSGLLAGHARSATGLRQVLADYFDVPVEIEQFVGAWYPVEEEAQCSLGETGGYSEQLGLGAVVGDEVWDQQARVRIRFGPLTLEQYTDFLPGHESYRHLRAITRFYAAGEFDMEIQLILRREDVPRCELCAEGEGPQLGWTSWVKNAPFPRDPGETVLEL
jgi:type VI secretion system protein ImpH